MAKLSGQYITIALDDSGDAPRQVESDIESIDIPDEYGELDATGFSDGAVNSIAGMPALPVEMTGTFNPAATTGIYTVAQGIVGKGAKTLTVAIGQAAAPVMGDPQFAGEFWLQKMNISATPQGKITITLSLRPSGSAAPAWSTVP
jgi:hypothetical protein